MNKDHRSPEAASVNLNELLARVDNDRELLRDLLSIFKHEFPDHLQGLRNAETRNDAAKAASISHTLKGMLANLAVTKGADSASRLERLARAGRSPPWPTLSQLSKKKSKDFSLKWKAIWPRRAREDIDRR